MNRYKFEFGDLAVIQSIIRESSESSLDVYFKQSTADFKSDGSIVTEADIAMQAAMTSALSQKYPDVMMLGEENTCTEQLSVIQSGPQPSFSSLIGFP